MRAGRRLGDDVEVKPLGGENVGFKGFMSRLRDDVVKQQKEQEEKKRQERERVKQLKKDKVPYCPKCHSTNITFVRKGVSLGRAVVGGAVGSVFSPLGTVAGAAIGGITGGKGKVKCLNCGKEWKL